MPNHTHNRFSIKIKLSTKSFKVMVGNKKKSRRQAFLCPVQQISFAWREYFCFNIRK